MESENTQTVIRNNNDMLDLLKFILSIFVVAIHTSIFHQILYPWLRLAVPLFFMISSYLLFSKLKSVSKIEGRAVVIKTVKRLFYLYLFWFIVLLPITVWARQTWFYNGITSGILTSIKQILFSSTFIGSWYIVASIWAILIIYFVSSIRCGKSIVLPLIVVSLLYLYCCLRSGYSFLVEHTEGVLGSILKHEQVLPSPVFSFPVALFWMTIGKFLAEDRLKVNKVVSVIVLCFSAVLLYFEWKLLYNHTGKYTYDCLILLAPVVVSLFVLLKDIRIVLTNSKKLRKMSTITYCCHASIAFFLQRFFEKINIDIDYYAAIIFFITLAVSHIACKIIFLLETNEKFSILKYSH